MHCHSRDLLHVKTSCPILAHKNMVKKEDKAASKIVLSKYEDHNTKKSDCKGKGGVARKPKAADNKNISGQRASSAE